MQGRLSARIMVALPWRWHGPDRHTDEHGNTWYEVRIEELPDFVVANVTAEAVIAEAGSALESFLDSYLSQGENPPMPKALEELRRMLPDDLTDRFDVMRKQLVA